MNRTSRKTVRVGIAGLGTVGAGTIKILTENADLIAGRTNTDIIVTAISARNKSKDRGIDLSKYHWVDRPQDIATREDVDIVIEAIGGESGEALDLVQLALEHKKPVITANKALMAVHGIKLSGLAEENNVPLLYEAAVAGGIPIIKLIREGLAANTINGLYGIMNGTCNYILTTMERTGQSFEAVLKEAQELGYAEADPTLDVGGGDSGHKLALLTALAFGVLPDYAGLSIDGIERIGPEDITIASEFGARIKLIGQATRLKDGRILQMVAPCLVPKTSPLAHVDGVLNGIFCQGDFVGPSFIEGRGAGAGPTASAIVADLMDVAIGQTRDIFGKPAARLGAKAAATADDWTGEFYMRLVVKDRPGVIAEIAPILRDHNISIESLIQRGRSEDQPVSIVIITHETTGQAMTRAARKIGELGSVLDTPLLLPILKI